MKIDDVLTCWWSVPHFMTIVVDYSWLSVLYDKISGVDLKILRSVFGDLTKMYILPKLSVKEDLFRRTFFLN